MKKTLLTLCTVVGLGFGALAQAPSSPAWQSQATGFTTPSRGIRDISITSPTTAWAVAYDGTSPTTSNVQEFTRTTNGGTTWTPGTIGTAAANHSFSNISAVNDTVAFVAMYNNGTAGGGKIFKTTDGGVTWTHQATATFAGPAGFPNIVHMFDMNNGWAQGDPNGGYFEMYTTTNGGTIWTRVPSANIPAPLSSTEYGTVDVYTTVGDTIYFGTNAGRVFKSTNGGLNWTVGGTTGLTSIHDITFQNGTIGLVRMGADLRRTTDGGATWSLVPYTGPLFTNDIKHVPGTARTYVSTGAATGNSGSSYSLNGGFTWTDFDFGTSQRLNASFFNPTVGWSGGFNTDATTNGIFKYTGLVNLTSTAAPTPPATPTITAGGPTTFCGGGSVALTAASATPNVTYRWFNNGTAITGATAATYSATATGNYTVTAISSGISSTPSAATAVTVTPKPATPVITKTGNMLTSTATTGTYQWFSVSGTTLTPVAGATSQTFTPAVNGDYTVRVTLNGCQSDAATTMNVVLGISSLAPGMDVSVYPNPSAGRFTVNLVGFEKEASIQIINVTGQVIASEKVAISSDKASNVFDLGDMAKGVYILKVTSGNNFTFRKVILD